MKFYVTGETDWVNFNYFWGEQWKSVEPVTSGYLYKMHNLALMLVVNL